MTIFLNTIGRIPLKISKIAKTLKIQKTSRHHCEATMAPYGTILDFLKTLDHPHYIWCDLSPTEPIASREFMLTLRRYRRDICPTPQKFIVN